MWMTVPAVALAAALGAIGAGLIVPQASAMTPFGNPSTLIAVSQPDIELAAVKKKVVKKKVVRRTYNTYGGYYGLSYYYPRPYYSNCRSVVRYVKYHKNSKAVRVVRRVC